MNVITQSEAATMIRQSGGKLFGVTFLTRKNRNLRRMTARVRPKNGWKTGVTGEGMKMNPADHDVIPVREFVTSPERGPKGHYRNLLTQFRCVSIEGITRLRVAGTEYKVVPDRSRPSPF